MYKNANGISPVLAFMLTLLAACLTFWLFSTGHVVWGVITAIICVDFLADFILSLKKNDSY